jgi:tetratricopeptide (TPR) repeat protein
MKWLVYLILAILVISSAGFYYSTNVELRRLKDEKALLQKEEEMSEEHDAKVAAIERAITDKANDQTLKGILLTFFSAGLIGIVIVTQVLPIFAHRITHAVYDSGEMVEKDPLHDAHSLVAQGDYVGAIEAFKEAAGKDPYNRLPWVEIAKIQRTSLEDPEAAIETLRSALENHEWPVNDAAYLLFRLAELYDEDRHDRTTAAAIMRQVIDEFPETRHSANARHKLHDWGVV